MTALIHGEMRQRVQDGFIIFFSLAYEVRLFRENLKLYRITDIPQDHHRPHLILNLSTNSYEGTPNINDTTDREVAPESMESGRSYPYLLQYIWEVDPAQGMVRMPKLDVTDAYH